MTVEPNREALLHQGVDSPKKCSCRSRIEGSVRIARIKHPEPCLSFAIVYPKAPSAEKRFSRPQKVEVSFGDAVA